MSKPNILFIQTINPGVVYYRMFAYAQSMSEQELAHVRMFPPWEPRAHCAGEWEQHLKDNLNEIETQVKWADVVVCQYINSVEGLSVIQAIRDQKPCFMEVDDYFKGVPYYNVAYAANRPGDSQDFWATRQMIESKGIICSTEYLAEQYGKYNPCTKVIPNCIDFKLWDSIHANGELKTKVRVGWIGGATHSGDLLIIKDALYSLLEKNKNMEVYIVSAPPPSDWPKHENLHMVHDWKPIDEYPQAVKKWSFDIGLVPLRDNMFNRAKSNLRYLEYSACKIPTVASPVKPFQKDFVGKLASYDKEWIQNIDEFIWDRAKARIMGQVAYEVVKNKFNVEKVSQDYFNYLKEYI